MRTWRATTRGPLILLLALILSMGTATAADAATTIAQDSFGRVVSGGFGSADTGGTWTVAGDTSRYSVANGVGQVATSPKVSTTAYLGSVSLRDVDLVATVSTSSLPVGGNDYAQLVVRHSGAADYSAVLLTLPSGGTAIALLNGSATLVSKSAGMTIAAGAAVRIRVQATGSSPTTLRARAWRAGSAEPSTWQITTTDSTAALQSTGVVGFRNYRSSGTTAGATTSIDDVAVTDPSTPTPNQPPVPTFTATTSARTVTVDASGSSDPDGSVVSYAWAFGDGATASGATAAHVYSTDGAFSITVTVTDSGGATASVTKPVTVSARPTQTQWLSDVSAALTGAGQVITDGAGSSRPALVLDVDNTSLQSYYQPFIATPQVLSLEQQARSLGYSILVATGRIKDTGGTAYQMGKAGYVVDDLCMRDAATTPVQTSKSACRAGWAAQGYTIVANIGNYPEDLAGGNSGTGFLLPNYGFLN